MSELKVTGKLTVVLDPASGTSKTGKEWNKQEFVINTGGDFPDDICFTLFGDKTKLIDGLNIGSELDVHFNVASREFNGKYYHNINAWKIDVIQSSQEASYPSAQGQPAEQSGAPVDDLPF